MSWIAAGTAAVGLASNVYGSIKSSKANKEADRQLDELERKNTAFYDKRLNQDYMESNAAKGLVEQMKKRYRDQAKEIDSSAAVNGSTAEATIAAKSAANDQFNEGLNQIGQQATYYQMNTENNYQQSLSDLYSKRLALNRNKANNASNLMAGGAQLIGTGADIAAAGKTAGVTEILKSNKGE